MSEVMIDLETMGKRPGSAIIAIGAVHFNESDILDQLYVNVDIGSCVKHELVMDAETVLWWMAQPDEARQALLCDNESLPSALLRFSSWFPRGASLWGNGSDFDNVILRDAYVAAKMSQPWHYQQNRCYRTMKGEFADVPEPDRIGTKHNALEDALHQAMHLQAIFARMRG